MGLKQDIVVVNEFTTRLQDKKGGSRGGTPGQYVLRYMARDRATEPLEPISRSSQDIFAYVTRYAARREATEVAGSLPELKDEFREIQGLGGRAFGYGQVSLSHDGLMAASEDIQRLFDDGHTVMKTVISFDQEYLRKHGLIPQDFECHERGDYKGHVDQLKLRMAIMHGLSRMASRYDDLRYIGVIQFDTEHVHCHLALVDAGIGNRLPNGQQRGKIDAKSKSFIRRGIDSWLDEKQTMAHLSHDVGVEKRNVTSFVKKWAHEHMLHDALPQFLIACLPEDRTLWRSGSNAKSMRKANAVVRELVLDLLADPSSPMVQAMASVQEYANERRAQEGLTINEWRELVHHGREQIIQSAINGIYTLLRTLPQDELTVRTPMLDVMSMDYEQLLAAVGTVESEIDPIIEFGFKLRSYSARLDHHTREREKYHEQVRDWYIAQEAGVADPASIAMLRWWEEEEEYHAMLMSKYQHFLPFAQQDSQWYAAWRDACVLGERIAGLEMMLHDQSLRRYKNGDEAEARGREIYGQSGGRLLSEGIQGVAIIEQRVARARVTYERKVDDLKVQLAAKGLVLDITDGLPEDVVDHVPSFQASTRQGTAYDFDSVKSLDMHHLGFDFMQDVQVNEQCVALFRQRAMKRRELLDDAIAYLENSGQSAALEYLPLRDVEDMVELSEKLLDEPVLPSELASYAARVEDLARVRRSATIHLGSELSEDVVQTATRQALDAVARFVPAEYRGISAVGMRRSDGGRVE